MNEITQIVLIVLAVLQLILFARAWVAWRASRRTGSGEARDVSIVIPLKGWDEGLPELCRQLLASAYDASLEILVVLDEDHPQRGELPSDERLRLIHPEAQPDGWRDKNWRLSQGLAQARFETILFMDSDVSADESTLARRLRDHAGDFSYAIPVYAEPGTPAEHLLSAFMSYANFFLYRFGVGLGVRATAIGPSMLFTVGRERLQEALEAVRDELADDHALGHHFNARGDRVTCARAPVFVAKNGENFAGVSEQIVRWLMLPRTIKHLLTPRLVVALLAGAVFNNIPATIFFTGVIQVAINVSPESIAVLLGGVFLFLSDGLLLALIERAYAYERYPKTPWRYLITLPIVLMIQGYWITIASFRRQIPWRGAQIPLKKAKKKA